MDFLRDYNWRNMGNWDFRFLAVAIYGTQRSQGHWAFEGGRAK